MENSKLLETIIQFYKAIGTNEPTCEDNFFVSHIELKLAESLIKDFGQDTALKVANVIRSVTPTHN